MIKIIYKAATLDPAEKTMAIQFRKINGDQGVVISVKDNPDSSELFNKDLPEALGKHFGGTWELHDYGEDWSCFISKDSPEVRRVELEPVIDREIGE